MLQGSSLNQKKKIPYNISLKKNWPKEFRYAKKINLKIMEWTINNENIKKNPLYNGNLAHLKKLIKNYQISIPSITNDYFMQKPFF